MIKITDKNDACIEAAAQAFADFEYADGENGIAKLYGDRKNIHDYILTYGQCMAQCGLLYATSENREGIVGFARPGQQMSPGAGLKLVRSIISIMGINGAVNMFKLMGKGGESLKNKLKKQKKGFVMVGMLAVAKPYQGQGFMRKTLAIPFAEGRRLNVPVILETDADLKMKKYVSCGMELYQERKLCEDATIYDMILGKV